MGFWQEIMLLVAAFGWWQTTLVLVATILLGILISLSVIYLIIRFVFKRRVPFLNTFYLFRKKSKLLTSSDLARRIITPSTPQEVHAPAKSPIPELLIEIEHNLKIVTEFTGDTLLTLQSDVWDGRIYSVRQLPVNLRQQLENIYFDIHLVNHIVWFSTELGYRSSSLDKLYSERLPTLAKRLQMIKENIIDSMLIEHGIKSEALRENAKIHSLANFSGQSKTLQETSDMADSRIR